MKKGPLTLPLIISFLFVFSSCTDEFDKYGGWTAIQGEKTGFFHLEEIDGRQWFINPEGNVFFPVALSHPFTGESAYVCKEQYDGNYQNYAEDAFEKLLNLGFNCSLSEHTSPERNLNGFVQADPILHLFEKHNFPYTVGIYLLKHPLEFAPGESYPDIFSASYLKIWADSIKKTCMKYKDNELVMGYYYGYGGLNNEVGFINSLLKRSESSPGRKTLLEYFVAKYGDDLEQYNSVYKRKALSIQDIEGSEAPRFSYSVNKRHLTKFRRKLDPDLVEDFEALINKVALHIFSFGHKEIREWDANHLILGSYLKPHSLNARTWKSVAPYIDAISPQHVVDVPNIDEFIEASGRPALISDQLFGIVYPEKIRFAAVENHAWRARIFGQICRTIASNPDMIGVSYCNCLHDQHDPSSRLAVGEQGFFDKKGNDRPEVSEPIKKMNNEIYSIIQHSNGKYQANIKVLMEMWEEANKGVSKDPERQWRPTKQMK